MMTIEQCVAALSRIADSPRFLEMVDDERVSFLSQFHGDSATIASQRMALVEAVKAASDFPTKSRVLDRLCS
jgi:hypothetical protein